MISKQEVAPGWVTAPESSRCWLSLCFVEHFLCGKVNVGSVIAAVKTIYPSSRFDRSVPDLQREDGPSFSKRSHKVGLHVLAACAAWLYL